MRRTIPDYTPDGLRRRLAGLERGVADLNRKGTPIPQYVEGDGAAQLPFYVAASDASDASKAVAAYVCSGTDDHLVIQQAVDDIDALYVSGAHAGPGAAVWLSEGTFVLGAAGVDLSPSSPSYFISVRGMGPGSTFVRGTGSGFVLDNIQGDALIIEGILFDGLTVAIDMQGTGNIADYLRVRNCNFYSCGTAIRLAGPDAAMITGCVFDACTTGINIIGTDSHIITDNHFRASTTDIAANLLVSCLIANNRSQVSQYFVKVATGNGLSVSGSLIADNIAQSTVTTLYIDGNATTAYFEGLDIIGNVLGGDNVPDIYVDRFTSPTNYPPLTLRDNLTDGSATVDVKCLASNNYIAGGLTVGATCPEALVTGNWLGDSNVHATPGTLTDSTAGTLSTGAGNYLDGVWSGGGDLDVTTDADGQRVALTDGVGATMGHLGTSAGGGDVLGLWEGDADGIANYDTALIAVGNGAVYAQDPTGGAWLLIDSDADVELVAASGRSLKLNGGTIKMFGAAGIDGSATPSTAAQLADVLVALGVIASHTIP